jgi:hypothetical protein
VPSCSKHRYPREPKLAQHGSDVAVAKRRDAARNVEPKPMATLYDRQRDGVQ